MNSRIIIFLASVEKLKIFRVHLGEIKRHFYYFNVGTIRSRFYEISLTAIYMGFVE